MSVESKIKGTVVLMKKNSEDMNDMVASVLDRLAEVLGRKVSLQLISAVNSDSGNKFRGKLGMPAFLENWDTSINPLVAGESTFRVTFEWKEEIGVPGAFLIRNFHHSEFYLKKLTLEDVPGHGRVHFICNSWVYPAHRYKKDRIFFTNEAYLPAQTPVALQHYREEELKTLKGNGAPAQPREWDRVYDYDVYNDLGDPGKGPELAREILGGSKKFPYPRRGRTGRPLTSTDPQAERRLPLLASLNIYVPRDERFRNVKMLPSVASASNSTMQFLAPKFDSSGDILETYKGGSQQLDGSSMDNKAKHSSLSSYGAQKFGDESAWRTDEEFAREMLAGVNPVVLCGLKEFPPSSKLDQKLYGDQRSTITEEHIKRNLDGLKIHEAIERNKMFILDYHDYLMPYLRRINSTSAKIYATRTILFLKEDGTLRPLAIELSLPHPDGDQFGAISEVYTPTKGGAEGTIWQLAKAYVAVNDSGYHQLISHWLLTHAVIEPFIIATNRQLSVLHPIYKLLHPHFRDKMNINASARQTLFNAGGLLERTVFPGRFAFELTSMIYNNWNFTEQALPADLIKRGIAIEDSNSKHGLSLLIEDYPFAVDGLEIWSAIKSWVEEYCNFYYRTDKMIQEDTELQFWWKELREKGHGDKKDEPWWSQMHTRKDLIDTCSIIIWVASALHAAVSFGQYPYVGYHQNRPTISRRFMPKPGTTEYDELKTNPHKAFQETFTSQIQSSHGVSLIEILSRHTSDEIFLGQRDTFEWISDAKPLKAFERFGKKLAEIEDRITNHGLGFTATLDLNLSVKCGFTPAAEIRTEPTNKKAKRRCCPVCPSKDQISTPMRR